MIKAALSLLTTDRSWDDLYLTKKALKQVEMISSLKKDITRKKKTLTSAAPSNVLFYGSQKATQLTTAALIGKAAAQSVYSIDLSKLVSKYIGETEKNLNILFDTAEQKDWILFFDEADALFGKRTDVKDSHDRYANIDTNYLLQKIEAHPGITLLATNRKSNIDAAFTRRLRYIINFPKPRKK